MFRAAAVVSWIKACSSHLLELNCLEGIFLSIVEKEKGVEYPTHEFMYLHLALHVEYH